MNPQPHLRQRAGIVLAALGLVAVVVAACSGGAVSSRSPSSAPSAAGLPAPTATPNATMAGPTTLAAWNDRQGFGGGSGMIEIQKGAHWLKENPWAADRSNWADWWSATVDGLAAWLDIHPATPCWTAYHASARQALARIQGDFVPIRTAFANGGYAPAASASDLVSTADALIALQPDASCP